MTIATLSAEWAKFRTIRGWVVAMVVAALLTVAVGVWATSGSHGEPCGKILPGGQMVGAACSAPPLGPGGEMVTDSFYFVHQELGGDGAVTARVASLSSNAPWAKAGIIVKASLKQGSPYAAIMVTGAHGVRVQYDYTHDTAVAAASVRWLRLVRAGDTVTGYDSADGVHWTRAGSVRLAGLPATVQAGLFVTSPESVTDENTAATMASADFDHVTGAGSGWAGQDIGGATAYNSLSGGFQSTPAGFTVRGSGDIAPAVATSAGSGRAADQGVIGAFAGLIVVLVVGTMFITAEYRRGLIRTTLAATPRRGQVLAAKAVVIGGVTFAAGLAGSVAAVLLGERMLRGSGFIIYPVGGLTQVRVVAGTAALLALAAVFVLAIGTITRHGAVPVTAGVALIVVPYFFTGPLAALHGAAGEWLLRVTPAAGFAIQGSLTAYPQVNGAYTPQYGYYPLSPLAGLGVLFAWTALALGLAAFVLSRRDV